MQQRKPLQRRTPLQRGNLPLRAKKPLKRIGITPGTSSVNPVKPRARKREKPSEEELTARAAVAARSGGVCEVQVLGVCRERAREFQHRVAKGQGGPWTASNGLAVCGHGNVDGCHGYIHQHPEEAVRHGWTVIRGNQDAHQVTLNQFVVRRGQRVMLDDIGGFTPELDGEGAE